jgi:ankyrin repeat protein
MEVEASTSIRLTELFIASGADLNELVGVMESYTPLINAAKEGRASSLRLLLAAGARPDCRDSRGRLALTAALVRHQTQCVRILLHHASDAHVTEALVHMCKENYDVPLSLLTKAGLTGINARFLGETPLTTAVRYSSRCMLKLLQAGADVNGTNSRGWTPLAVAAMHGQWGVAKVLLDHRDIDANPVVDTTAHHLRDGSPHMGNPIPRKRFIASTMTPLLIAAVTQSVNFEDILHHEKVDTLMTTSGDARGRLVEEIARPSMRDTILEARRKQVCRSRRRKMAAFRIQRFLRDTTCNPMYAAARRSLMRQY